MAISIGVILGSTRPNRSGEIVANWFMEQVKQFPDITFELIDLEKVNLPILDEGMPAMMHQYQQEHTKQWSEMINKHDGYIVITAEYNHTVPGALKNAIDYLNTEWNHKPMGFVSYGGGAGGARAVEHLRQIATELRMVAMRDQILIPMIWEHVKDGALNPEAPIGKVETIVKELQWWAEVLKEARAKKS